MKIKADTSYNRCITLSNRELEMHLDYAKPLDARLQLKNASMCPILYGNAYTSFASI